MKNRDAMNFMIFAFRSQDCLFAAMDKLFQIQEGGTVSGYHRFIENSKESSNITIAIVLINQIQQAFLILRFNICEFEYLWMQILQLGGLRGSSRCDKKTFQVLTEDILRCGEAKHFHGFNYLYNLVSGGGPGIDTKEPLYTKWRKSCSDPLL